MLKICGSTIYRPLDIIFKEALSTGLFPSPKKLPLEVGETGSFLGHIIRSLGLPLFLEDIQSE